MSQHFTQRCVAKTAAAESLARQQVWERGVVSRDHSFYSRQKRADVVEERILSDFKFPRRPNLCKSADLKAGPHQLMAQLIPV